MTKKRKKIEIIYHQNHSSIYKNRFLKLATILPAGSQRKEKKLNMTGGVRLEERRISSERKNESKRSSRRRFEQKIDA